MSGTLFDQFIHVVQNGTLSHVSWIVAPEAYSEHPNWPPHYGAWFIAQVLDILTSKPEVWAKTALFVTYDENDGFFDHMVPPTPPRDETEGASTVSTEHEHFAGNATYQAGPYGLGVRVPMLVVSPWSRGGVVNSQLFDHTSIIRFIEQRFGPHHAGLVESNITPWRRAYTRAETLMGFIGQLDDFAKDAPEIHNAYGGKSLSARSHGESYLQIFEDRVQPRRRGIYRFDEPEAALSPIRQIQFLRIMQEAAATGNAQFILATHSPLIMAYPGATILHMTDTGITEASYRATEHFQILRDFYANPDTFMAEKLG